MSKMTDLETTARIKLALITSPHVGGLEIGVTTINGIVFLSGSVQDHSQKSLAEELALEYGGLDIKNEITVLSEEVDDEEILLSPAEPADIITRERVYGALENDTRINSFTINVESNSGVVRLSGVQNDPVARMRAEEIANRVQGVQDVVNEIEVVTEARNEHV